MNRYDANFNDVDPVTCRPFSWGHPDGVWIIAIVYSLLGLISFAVITVGVYRLFTSGLPGLPILLAGGIELFLFLSAIILLFKRSEKSLYPAAAILALFAAGLVIAGFSGIKPFLGAFVALLAQSYICYYLHGLEKDGLLGNEATQKKPDGLADTNISLSNQKAEAEVLSGL